VFGKKSAALQNDQDSVFSSQHATSTCRRLTTWAKIRWLQIDDLGQNTLAAASTLEARERFSGKDGVESATLVGTDIAQRLKEKGIEQVVFDKGGFIYHGRVKALAEAARGEGLNF